MGRLLPRHGIDSESSRSGGSVKFFFRKLRWLTRRPEKEAELREELQFHLEQEAEQNREHRLAEDETRWAARRELGNLALVEEDTRTAWGWTRLEQFARDAGYGLRQIRRNPVFSAIAIATLASFCRKTYKLLINQEKDIIQDQTTDKPGRRSGCGFRRDVGPAS